MDTFIEQDRYTDFFKIYTEIDNNKDKIDFICKFIISKFKEQSISAMVGAGFSR